MDQVTELERRMTEHGQMQAEINWLVRRVHELEAEVERLRAVSAAIESPTVRRGPGSRRISGKQSRHIIKQIAKRDGWVCWLCHDGLDPDLPRDSGAAASLDHVLPLSKGGSNHQVNLKLAHRRCNGVRADSVDPQPQRGSKWPSYKRQPKPGLAGPGRTEVMRDA